MARGPFTISDYLSTSAGTGVSGYPVSLSSWFRSTDIAQNQTAFCQSAPGLPHFMRGWVRGATAGDPCAWDVFNTSRSIPGTSTGYTANQWYHLLVVSYSATSHKVWINGGSVGVDTTSVTYPSVTQVSFGVTVTSVVQQPLLGYLCECARWAAGLVEADAVLLYQGYAPTDPRLSASPVNYWPMSDGSTDGETDVISGLNASETGAVGVFDSPMFPVRGGLTYSAFDPSILKAHLTDGAGNLKDNLVTAAYGTGTPDAAGELRPSLEYSDGRLKEGLTTPDGATLKPSILI